MSLKLTTIIYFIFLSTNLLAQKTKSSFVNPTGSYILKSNAKIKYGETYGHSCDISVKLLDTNKIAMSFFINKGYPSYNSGSFDDTLYYTGNKAVYKYEGDSTCLITFIFSSKGIQVDHQADNYNNSCGFGHAVVATGFFKKKSSKIPVIKDPFRD